MKPTGTRRAKVSLTLDPDLLHAVDVYVEDHEGLDRSKVVDEALSQWYTARQAEAMAAQFEGGDIENVAERDSWRQIRRAATGRRLERRKG
jgi:metal-responsive CopG/Arc/MetJ family transcriptional regulator